MSSVVLLDPADPADAALIARRHALDIDRKDEIWKGVYHVNPAARRRHGRIIGQLLTALDSLLVGAGSDLEAVAEINVGTPDDFRVPDAAVLPPGPGDEVWFASAALVVEVTSPGDDTLAKLPHYAAHAIDEVLIVHELEPRMDVYRRGGDGYGRAERSHVLGVDATELATRIRWPD